MDYDAVLAQVLALLQQEHVSPIGYSSAGCSSMTRRWKTSKTT